MSNPIDAIIVGAGPYGLSMAANLRAAGVDFRIFGEVMGNWKRRMPPGMLLKSWPCSSNLHDPNAEYTVKAFYGEQGLVYHDSLYPVPVETFAAYGDAFQKRYAPHAESKMLAALEPCESGFRATFDDGEVVITRRAIIAVGVHPFKYTPDSLANLPPEVLSHSADHGPLDAFAGKEVAVLGAGASASGLAALLHERGASVTLVARDDKIEFSDPPQETSPSLPQRIAGRMLPIRMECAGLGGGVFAQVCAQAPWMFHALPERRRLYAVRVTLGPSGHGSMKDRVVGKVPIRTGRKISVARMEGGRISLAMTLPDGKSETLRTDRLITATGYRVDLGRLGFLGASLLSRLDAVERTPILSFNHESSVPGLYFVGPAAANSFGPVSRFVVGSMHSSPAVARHVKKALAKRSAFIPARSHSLVGGAE